MAICPDCKQEMSEAETCTYNSLYVEDDRTVYRRDTTYFDVNERCHDCNIVNKPGNIHHFGCDMERGPICEGQLISCGCFAKKGLVIAVKIV